MEIIQFLIKFFLSNGSNSILSPIIEKLQKNNFNIGETLKDFDISSLLPLLTQYFGENKSSMDNSTEPNSLAPISSIADKNIIYSLNRYFADN